VNSFAEVQNEVLQERPGQRPEEVEERTYAELGKGFDLDPAMLKDSFRSSLNSSKRRQMPPGNIPNMPTP